MDPTPLLRRADGDLRTLDDWFAEGAARDGRAPATDDGRTDPDGEATAVEPLFGPWADGVGSFTPPSRASVGREPAPGGIRFADRPPAGAGPEPFDGFAAQAGPEAGPMAGHDDRSHTPVADATARGEAAALTERLASLERERDLLRQMLADRQDDVGAAVARLESVATAVRDQMTDTVVRLATLIAKRVIERELEADPDLVVTLTRAAVAQLENCTTAEVRVHPTDYAVVQRHLERGSDRVDYPIVRVIGDGSIPRGGCVVATEGAEVDGLLDTRLRRLEETLHGAMTARVAEPAERREA